MPDGLELHQRRDLDGLCLRRRTDRQRAPGGSASRCRRPGLDFGEQVVGHARDVDRVHVHVTGEPRDSSAVGPVRMFTTPPGTSEVARTSRARRLATDRSPMPAPRRCSPRRSRARCGRPVRAEADRRAATTPTTPVGSGSVKLKYGPGHRVRGTERLVDLVAPARVPDPPVDRGVDPALGVGGAGVSELLDELRPPALHELRHAVEDLAPVVGG